MTPHFIPHARAGNYVQGVSLLIDKIEEWITTIDRQKHLAQQQAAVGSQQIKQNATAIVASREKLYADVQLQIKHHAESGFDLASQQQRAKQAYETLTQTTGQIDNNGPQALKVQLRLSKC